MICRLAACTCATLLCTVSAHAADVIPALDALKTDRPRLLVRPKGTPYAISLRQLKTGPHDKDFAYALDKLKRQKSAAAQAMVWLLTGEAAAADKAVARMRAYDNPTGKGDAFTVYFRLREFALAYDWLHTFKGFTAAIVGGLGNTFGAVAGGLFLGLVEELTAGFLTVVLGISSGFKEAIAAIVLILILLWRPQGILGKGVVEKV